MSPIVCCQNSKASQSSFNLLERHFLEKSRQTKMLLRVRLDRTYFAETEN